MPKIDLKVPVHFVGDVQAEAEKLSHNRGCREGVRVGGGARQGSHSAAHRALLHRKFLGNAEFVCKYPGLDEHGDFADSPSSCARKGDSDNLVIL